VILERRGLAVGSAASRSLALEGVGVEPENIGDDGEQRCRVKAKVGGTFSLRQDVTFQKAVQEPAQPGTRVP
jgi:hypothetical protein